MNPKAGHFWSDLWWHIRGVGVNEYRRTCRRCRYTGQRHWKMRPGEMFPGVFDSNEVGRYVPVRQAICWRFRK